MGGLPTPLTKCTCACCGGTFNGRPREHGDTVCSGCNEVPSDSIDGNGPNAKWQATLRTDVPRLLRVMGKIPDRSRCVRCGALQPHRCPIAAYAEMPHTLDGAGSANSRAQTWPGCDRERRAASVTIRSPAPQSERSNSW